jgi:hypothetical protein
MRENVSVISSDAFLRKKFQLPKHPHLIALLKKHGVESIQSQSRVEYAVDKDTVNAWLSVCSKLWQGLVKATLLPNGELWNIKKESPDHETVQAVVQYIVALATMKRVLEHLFTLHSLDIIFRQAGKFLSAYTACYS